MVGTGDMGGSALYWNSAGADSNGNVNLGNYSTTPGIGPPIPIPSDTYWTSQFNAGSHPTVPMGTYQDAGFAWGGRGAGQWGEGIVSTNPLDVSNSPYNSNTFTTTFYNPTYDPPSNSALAASVAAIGSNMATVAKGDSGGAAFVQTSTGWSLAGTLAYTFQYSRNTPNPSTNPSSAYGDVSADIDLSTYRSAILNIINSTVTWTGQASNSWDTSSSNWANAAQNGSTAFVSTPSTAVAFFGNTNPLFAIPFNSSLQTITIPTSVSVASITFSNTGSARTAAPII